MTKKKTAKLNKGDQSKRIHVEHPKHNTTNSPNHKSRWKLIGSIAAGLLLIIGLIKDPLELYDRFFPPTDDPLQGVLLPQSYNNRKEFIIQMGSKSTGYVIQGIKENEIYPPPRFLICDGEPAIPISYMVRDGKIFFSTHIKCLENEKPIADLDFNTWTIYHNNISSKVSTDTSLRILDKDKNIALLVRLKNPNTIDIQGYWVGETSVSVSSGEIFCISKDAPNYKDSVRSELRKILLY